MRLVALFAVSLLGLAPGRAHAQEEPLVELLIAGEQPGPGLWQVRHDDHVLYVLGTLTPMPAKVEWRSREAERRLAESGMVISGLAVRGTGVGVFAGLRLLPSVLRARKLPKGETLQAVLEPPLYARWRDARSRYLPRDNGIETLRPAIAGVKLAARALEVAGLRDADVGGQLLERVKLRKDAIVRKPEVQIAIDDPRGLVREYAESPPALEADCLDSLLTRVESGMPTLQRRAEAWSRGDVATLRQLRTRVDTERCLGTLATLPRIQDQIREARRRVRQELLLVSEGAVLQHPVSFAILPMEELLDPDGLLAQLKQRGYDVVEPIS